MRGSAPSIKTVRCNSRNSGATPTSDSRVHASTLIRVRQRKRPQLDALMNDARKRVFDVVLVWKFDRFARSVKHLVDSLEEFRALGIDFTSYTENVDTTTPSGQLLFHIMGAVAQFERDLIAERVRAGIAHARAMGKRIGRPRAEIDLTQVRTQRGQGRSLRQIAKSLDVPVSRVRRALAIGTSKSSDGPDGQNCSAEVRQSTGTL